MDFTVKDNTSIAFVPTKTQGTEMFQSMQTNGNIARAFKAQPNSAYPWAAFELINKEVDRLWSEIGILMSGRHMLTAEVSHFDEELMETVIDNVATYYTPTTKTSLKTMFASDYLDDTAVLRAFVSWKGYNYDTQFEAFVASYNN